MIQISANWAVHNTVIQVIKTIRNEVNWLYGLRVITQQILPQIRIF